jgi:hypothetical protein
LLIELPPKFWEKDFFSKELVNWFTGSEAGVEGAVTLLLESIIHALILIRYLDKEMRILCQDQDICWVRGTNHNLCGVAEVKKHSEDQMDTIFGLPDESGFVSS